MYGLNAIGAANGWSMAILGVIIVFSGLVALSLAISQLHRILIFVEKCGSKFGGSGMFEAKGKKHSQEQSRATPPDSCPHPYVCPTDVNEIARIWEPLVDRLDSPFYLSELYERARKYNFPHPHITITRLRNAGVLVSRGEGLFEWNADATEEGL